MKKLRRDYLKLITRELVERLIFVDETGVHLALTRLYGRAAPGERVVDSVPENHGGNQTFLAALGLTGITAPWVFEGALNGEIFLIWVLQVLCPTLQLGDIVVMDNLPAHKVAGVEEAIVARGAKLIYLSPYSPDFNPIERCWLKIKTFLRKAKPRTVKALIEAIKQALSTVTEEDARAWFAHCGYSVPIH